MKKCAAFWTHTNLRSGNRIYPCCRFKEPVQTFNGDVGSILHSSEYEVLRNTDVSTLSSCAKCMHEESNGKESLRQQFNQQYTTDIVELKYLEIGFDNICDLACDGCWSEWSHTWALKENPDATIKKVIVSSDELENIPDTVEKVLFLGGEPLMTNRHRKFLKSVNHLEKLEVIYNTNGMHRLQNEDYDILANCKSVKFIVSIDGYASLNEKVRTNSVWTTIVDNVEELVDTFDLSIHTTVHKNNWHGLVDLYNWINDKKYKWTTNVLTYPKHLDIVNLSNEEKQTLTNVLNNYDIPDSDYIKEHLNGC